MPLILCLETTTTNCSVALAMDGKFISMKEDNSPGFSHAEKLHLFIGDILKENNFSPNDLDAVAVSSGPGSYTGLRIGVASAKGLCFSLNIPLIAIDTLKALASKVKKKTGIIIPLLDARRMEVYTAGFSLDLDTIFKTQAKVLEADSFLEYLNKGEVSFIGSGVPKFKEVCNHPNANFIEGELPSAAQMLPFAVEKFRASEFEDVAYYEPFYLKEFMLG